MVIPNFSKKDVLELENSEQLLWKIRKITKFKPMDDLPEIEPKDFLISSQ